MAPTTANGTLSFAPTADQPNSQTLFGPEYVLSGGTGLVPINYSATPVSASEILLIDFLNNVNEKPLGTTRWRLARFAVKHTTSNPTLSHGDTYEIKMFQKSQDLTEDTAFFDSTHDLHILGRPLSPVEPFADSGSIRVTAAATAVPEPSVAVTVGLLTAFVGFRRRRHSSQNSCS